MSWGRYPCSAEEAHSFGDRRDKSIALRGHQQCLTPFINLVMTIEESRQDKPVWVEDGSARSFTCDWLVLHNTVLGLFF